MSATNLEVFLRALSRISAESRTDLDLSVKYQAQSDVYWAWLPPLGEYFTSDGIRDPGLGSGPINFRDIEYLVLHPSHRRKAATSAYSNAFALVRAEASKFGASIAEDGSIVVTNGS
jgi:hypothetical protein